MALTRQSRRVDQGGSPSSVAVPQLEVPQSEKGGMSDAQSQAIQQWVRDIVNQMATQIQSLERRVQQLETKSK